MINDHQDNAENGKTKNLINIHARLTAQRIAFGGCKPQKEKVRQYVSLIEDQ